MQCPDCDGDLVSTRVEDVELDECSGCRGLWLDRGELSTLAAADVRPPEEASYARFTRHPGGLSWRCPRCATDSLEFGEIAGVGAALCADCRGVFFSGDQIRRLRGLQRGDGQFRVIDLLSLLLSFAPVVEDLRKPD
jgi:hypothetical protein